MSGHPAQGLWSGRHHSWHINCLEMLAVFRALKYFLPDLRDRHVLVRTDNTAVVYYINYQGGLRSRPLYKLAHQILVWSQDKLLSLLAVHVPGHLNVGANVLSRQGPRPGEWMLHPEVFIQLPWDWMPCYRHGRGEAVEAVGVASEGAQLIASGLSTEVVETILQSRAPSTRKLYALKWKLFTSWCGERQQDPVNCPVGTVLEFLQARFSTGLSHSTLKVYVAAISAYHAPLGGMSVGKDPLVVRFLRGVLRLRPPTRPHVSTWDLAVVLEALSGWGPAGPSHLEFAPGMTKAFLYPRPGYFPKVPTNTPQPVVLQAFCPPPFREPDQQKQNCMCPVRALDAYVHRAALWRKTDQLFVCYGPPKKGYPATKQTLSRWIIDAISTAYEFSDLPSPLGVKAHSTCAMAASKALLAGVPIQDIFNAAGWSTPLTFRFRTLLEFLKGNVPGNVCNHGFLRERDTASRSILSASLLSARFIPRS
ncbi:ORF V: Enzymatic polyprotein [Labeo rohita]|uniref:ORF V: Enzymatic polyprotein n=1 Tax=Labeo rohita TaxID=84645 RepID=A0ABQ8L4S1_LABRO|nr:ORF V: Enzymatic polyprotein [Labeo rohita]